MASNFNDKIRASLTEHIPYCDQESDYEEADEFDSHCVKHIGELGIDYGQKQSGVFSEDIFSGAEHSLNKFSTTNPTFDIQTVYDFKQVDSLEKLAGTNLVCIDKGGLTLEQCSKLCGNHKLSAFYTNEEKTWLGFDFADSNHDLVCELSGKTIDNHIVKASSGLPRRKRKRAEANIP